MMPALNSISDQQAHPSQNNGASITYLLYYAATNTTVLARLRSSNMVLHIDIDASHLSEPWARSHTVGNYYYSSQPAESEKSSHLIPP